MNIYKLIILSFLISCNNSIISANKAKSFINFLKFNYGSIPETKKNLIQNFKEYEHGILNLKNNKISNKEFFEVLMHEVTHALVMKSSFYNMNVIISIYKCFGYSIGGMVKPERSYYFNFFYPIKELCPIEMKIKESVIDICGIIADSISYGKEGIIDYCSDDIKSYKDNDITNFNKCIVSLSNLLAKRMIYNNENIKINKNELIEKIMNIVIRNVYKFIYENIFFIEKITNEKFITLIESDGRNFYKFNGNKIDDISVKSYSIPFNGKEDNPKKQSLEFYFNTNFHNNPEYASFKEKFNKMIEIILYKLNSL